MVILKVVVVLKEILQQKISFSQKILQIRNSENGLPYIEQIKKLLLILIIGIVNVLAEQNEMLKLVPCYLEEVKVVDVLNLLVKKR